MEALNDDRKRYHGRYYMHPGFWVTLSYRIRELRKFGSLWCRFLLPMDMLLGLIRRCLSDVILPSGAILGKGLYLPHPNGIIIHERTVIGDGVAIFQQVTIGERKGGVPTIDDHCALYSGAKVLGGIFLGKHVQVGANAVVVHAVKAGMTVVGIPAKPVAK